MKALIVDDERHAREELAFLLRPHPEIEITGYAANAQEARRQLAQLKPDLMFLDIQMPVETGLELLSSLEGPMPHVIFTTAYDSYAIRAFDFGAADYLLKPISPQRLAIALSRLLSKADDDTKEPAEEENAITEPEQQARVLKPTDKILLSEPERIWYTSVAAIIGAESVGPHSAVWLESGTPVVRRSLATLESRLPPELFFRANRIQLINLQHVREVTPWFSGGLKIQLTGKRSVELSRRQAKIFREISSL